MLKLIESERQAKKLQSQSSGKAVWNQQYHEKVETNKQRRRLKDQLTEKWTMPNKNKNQTRKMEKQMANLWPAVEGIGNPLKPLM